MTNDEHWQVPEWMSARELVELSALAEITENGSRPSFIHYSKEHRKLYESLRRHGLVLWTYPHPKMGHPFAESNITEAGLAVVEKSR